MCLCALLLPNAVDGQTLDDIPDELREGVEPARITTFIAGFFDLSEEPLLSSATFTVDTDPELDVELLELPFWTTVGEEGEPRLYLEGGLGLLRAETSFADIFGGVAPGLEASIDTECAAVTAIGGIGIEIPLGDEGTTTLTPIRNLGVGHIANEADYGGPGAPLVELLVDEILFEWDLTVLDVGGAVRIDDRRIFPGDLRLENRFRYDIRWTETLRSTDRVLDMEEVTQRISLRVEGSAPTTLTLFRRDIRVAVYAGYFRFLGDTGEVLGFDDYGEIGLAFGIPAPAILSDELGLRLEGSLLYGDQLPGYSLGVGVEF